MHPRDENPLPALAPMADEEFEPSGYEPLELSAADRVPSQPFRCDAALSAPTVHLPDSSPRAALVHPKELCGAAVGLLAEAAETFLPPAADPQILAWPAAEALPLWSTDAADWTMSVDVAEPVSGLAAEAVESYLPPAADPQILAWPGDAVGLPQLTLNPADWTMSVDLAEPAAGPAAAAVESYLPAATEQQILTWPADAVELPQLTLNPADWTMSVDVAEPAAGPAAAAVESYLPPSAEQQILAWPVAAVGLPQLTLNPADWMMSVDVAEPAAGPAAAAVESYLPPCAEQQILAWPDDAVELPQLTLNPADWTMSVDLAEPATGPAAAAVESYLPAATEPQAVTWSSPAVLPTLALHAADWAVAATLAEPAAASSAEAAETFLPLAAELRAVPPSLAAIRLPDLVLTAAEPEPVEEFVPPLVVSGPSERCRPGLPACEAVRDAIPAFVGALPTLSSLLLPTPLAVALEQPTVRWAGDWRPSSAADPVTSFVAPRLQLAIPPSYAVSVPDLRILQKTPVQRAARLAQPSAERYPEAAQPSPSDAPVLAASSEEQSGRRPQVLWRPAFEVEQATGTHSAPFRPGDPPAVEPAAATPNPGSAIPRPDPASAFQEPAPPQPALYCGFPFAEPAAMDFICQRTPMAPVVSLQSIALSFLVHAPKFVVRPIFERIEEAVAPPKPVEKTPAFAEIFAVSRGTRRATSHGSLFSAGKLIAASLLVGVGMWFGAGSVKIGRQMLAINTGIRNMGSSTSPDLTPVSPAPAPGFPSPRYSAPKAPEGPIASVRRAIQQRAAVELTDTFRRMEAWGAGALALPAGWSRHPDGYVRTGQLALYRPAQTFADYHFEFFGEIERKSLSWAVRARDTQNYYAMKMTVIEPGLRPVVAVVHYPVVGGKKGHRVETPLSIMMHNHEPYHVAVEREGQPGCHVD